VRFIGDVHGKFEFYWTIVEKCDESIQVGDMGAGFRTLPKVPMTHRFIRGNHDSPEVCKADPHWIPDGKVENGMMFIGGAWSIDQEWRIPGISWWEDEELSYREFEGLIDKYERVKPEVMVTHDCPTIMAKQVHSHHFDDNSRTREALDTMFEIHCPDLWIFGHHHVSMKGKAGSTDFIALAELDFIDITFAKIETAKLKDN